MRHDIQQLAKHALIALLVWCLPWALAFRALRLLTRFGLGASPLDGEAVLRMPRYGFCMSPQLAVRQMRLHRLIDIADFYKSFVMNRGWLRRYWRVSGDALPDPEQHPAVLFVTFHYGAGFWALRYFQQHGLHMAALYRPPPRPQRAPRFDYYFFWLRLRSIFRLTRTKPIRVGDSQSEQSVLLRRLLRDRQPVGVMPDIPTPAAAAIEVDIFDTKMYFAQALLRVVVKRQIPVVLYTSVLDLHDGGRNLDFQVLYQHTSVEALAQTLANTLQQALTRDPTAWHLWPFADEILHPQT
ncbi:MAG: hypothetical protein QMB92_10790 [Thiopseudomonas sp.]